MWIKWQSKVVNKQFWGIAIIALLMVSALPMRLFGQTKPAASASSFPILLQDKKTLGQIKGILDAMYDGRYSESVEGIKNLPNQYNIHPAGALLSGLNQYWENYPIAADAPKYAAYKNTLEEAITKAQNLLKARPKDPEGIFFEMMAHMMLSKHEFDIGENMSAVGHMRKAYNYIIEGRKFVERFPEFYFTSGLYDYFREAVPEARPLIKPVMWFFPSGNKARGIEQLRKATQLSVFTQVEAELFLARIYLYFEHDPKLGLKYAQELAAHHPENMPFKVVELDAYLLAGQYKQVIEKSDAFKAPNHNLLFRYSKEVYKIAALQQLNNDLLEAKEIQYLQSVYGYKGPYNKVIPNVKATAAICLARHFKKLNNKKQAETYYEYVKEHSLFKSFRQEASAYLD